MDTCPGSAGRGHGPSAGQGPDSTLPSPAGSPCRGIRVRKGLDWRISTGYQSIVLLTRIDTHSDIRKAFSDLRQPDENNCDSVSYNPSFNIFKVYTHEW